MAIKKQPQEITLEFLRQELKELREAQDAAAAEAAEHHNPDAWDVSRIILGRAVAIGDLIKRMRGLTEREFQLEIKKGTL
jgi:hypothetical protein